MGDNATSSPWRIFICFVRSPPIRGSSNSALSDALHKRIEWASVIGASSGAVQTPIPIEKPDLEIYSGPTHMA